MIRATTFGAALSLFALAAPIVDAKSVDQATRDWQQNGAAEPIQGEGGIMLYPFGQGTPTIKCRPIYGCELELQPGETIQNVMLGDTVRWISGKAKSGEGATTVYHVVLKPTTLKESDGSPLGTHLLITTSRRTYFVVLQASATGYASRVGWYYPADIVQSWAEEEEKKEKVEADRAALEIDTLSVSDLSKVNLDAYEIKGDRHLRWYPVRVFDNGKHVWIQERGEAVAGDAPALVLLNAAGNTELVNYRVKNGKQGDQSVTYYIVDKVFDHAALIVGVGDDQQMIEIIRRHPE